MVKVEKGVLHVRGKDAWIVVPAKAVRKACTVRNPALSDCSARWLQVTYENVQGELKNITIEASDGSVATMLANQVADYALEEMGRDYEEK